MKRNVDLTLDRDFSDYTLAENKRRARSKAKHLIPWDRNLIPSDELSTISHYSTNTIWNDDIDDNISLLWHNNSTNTIWNDDIGDNTSLSWHNNRSTISLRTLNIVYTSMRDNIPNRVLKEIYKYNHYWPYEKSNNDYIINKILRGINTTIWGVIEKVNPYKYCKYCYKKVVPWKSMCNKCNNTVIRSIYPHEIPWIREKSIEKDLPWWPDEYTDRTDLGKAYVPWQVSYDQDPNIRVQRTFREIIDLSENVQRWNVVHSEEDLEIEDAPLFV